MTYKTRDIIQSSAADCTIKQMAYYQSHFVDSMMYGLFAPETRMFQNTDHMLVNETGAKLGTYSGEAAAICAAEDFARSQPGRKFFVLKAVSVSVAETPVVTKKL